MYACGGVQLAFRRTSVQQRLGSQDQSQRCINSLLELLAWVRVCSITSNTLINDILTVCHSVTPERGRVNLEIGYNTTSHVGQSQRNRSSVPIQSGVIRVKVPPRLSENDV